MIKQSIGLIETVGLSAAVEAADAAVKSANVSLVGYELTKGGGMVTIKILGDVAAVNAGIAAARAAAARVNQVVTTKVIARPAAGIESIIITPETVGIEPVIEINTFEQHNIASAQPTAEPIVENTEDNEPTQQVLETEIEQPHSNGQDKPKDDHITTFQKNSTKKKIKPKKNKT